MNILFAASEVAPFIKTGGLADVAGSLPQKLADMGHDVKVILPLYEGIGQQYRDKMRFLFHWNCRLAWRTPYCGVFELREGNISYLFVDNEYYFERAEIYGHYDDGERFAFFSKAVLESLQYLNWYPDVIHANDWQTAMIPVFLRAFYMGLDAYQPIRTLFTIHNMEYQGKAPESFVDEVLGLPEDWRGTTQFDGCTNMMKAAILVSDRVSTVSRTYAYEIQDP